MTTGPAELPANEGTRDVRSCVHPADRGGLRPARRDPEGGGTVVNLDNAVGLVLVVLLAVFLIAALLFPERF
ncbi:K(+)-transporting ATPase subunit F [Rhodococcus sp. 21391]|nr:K(+)-transporting ATPase subunit F [Rhodococcus sp. 21391]